MRRWVSFESKSAQPARQGRPQAPPLAGLVSGKLVIYAASTVAARPYFAGAVSLAGVPSALPGSPCLLASFKSW